MILCGRLCCAIAVSGMLVVLVSERRIPERSCRGRRATGSCRQSLTSGSGVRDQLRLEGAVVVVGNLNWQFAELALQGLLALAVADVACGVLDRFALVVAQMIDHLGFQRLIHQQLRELLEQPVSARASTVLSALPPISDAISGFSMYILKDIVTGSECLN